jgi:hypothetical protein
MVNARRPTYRRRRPANAKPAYKKRARYSKRPRKQGIYKNVSSNVLTIKCRVPFEIRRDEMVKNADDSLSFNFVNAPWRNVSTTTQNRLYDADFLSGIALYQQYKLARVEYIVRRPKQYLGASTTIDPTQSFGSQILHTRQVMTANGTTSSIESTAAISQHIMTSSPTSWKEAIDGQSTTFHVHGYKRECKRTWLPGCYFEKRWRNKNVGTDQELACGGMLLMVKQDSIVPEIAGTLGNAQVMFEGYADVFINFCRRT